MELFIILNNMKKILLVLVLVGMFLPVFNVRAESLTGSRKIAVILFNFQNDVSQPDTVEAVRRKTFTDPDSVATFYLAASYNKLTLWGDVIGNQNPGSNGWYTIDSNHPGFVTCPSSDQVAVWSVKALRQANLDVDPRVSGYDYYIFLHPATGPCGDDDPNSPDRLGTVYTDSVYPNLSRYVFINGQYSNITVAHEVGHLFDWDHANGLLCNDIYGQRSLLAIPIKNCRGFSYADPYSVMGGASNAPQFPLPDGSLRESVGWLAPFQILQVVQPETSTSQHIYDLNLSPLSANSSGIKMIKINKLGFPRYSYGFNIEYRPPLIGPFDKFNSTQATAGGVLVRMVFDPDVGFAYDGNRLIDAKPNVPNDLSTLFQRATLDPNSVPLIDIDSGLAMRVTNIQ